MAAISHISVVLPFMGVIGPILIWVTQKDKSKYVAFQSLQALTLQLLMIFAWFLGMVCYLTLFFGIFLMIPLLQSTSNLGGSEILFAFPFFVVGLLLKLEFLFILYGIIGAVRALQGRDFRYVMIGPRLERYLQKGT